QQQQRGRRDLVQLLPLTGESSSSSVAASSASARQQPTTTTTTAAAATTAAATTTTETLWRRAAELRLKLEEERRQREVERSITDLKLKLEQPQQQQQQQQQLQPGQRDLKEKPSVLSQGAVGSRQSQEAKAELQTALQNQKNGLDARQTKQQHQQQQKKYQHQQKSRQLQQQVQGQQQQQPGQHHQPQQQEPYLPQEHYKHQESQQLPQQQHSEEEQAATKAASLVQHARKLPRPQLRAREEVDELLRQEHEQKRWKREAPGDVRKDVGPEGCRLNLPICSLLLTEPSAHGGNSSSPASAVSDEDFRSMSNQELWQKSWDLTWRQADATGQSGDQAKVYAAARQTWKAWMAQRDGKEPRKVQQ
ncbi:unnamed protein product, partial [Polarella glacialis]